VSSQTTSTSAGGPSESTSARLHSRLDFPLPAEVVVGAGTALVVCGSCYCEDAQIDRLWVTVGEGEQPTMFHGMPRIDVFRAAHPGIDPYTGASADPDSPDDPGLRSFRSGFWAIVELDSPARDGELTIGVRAELGDGTHATAPLATITAKLGLAAVATPLNGLAPGPPVAIAMATYEPPLHLFARQIESIRAQTHRNWVCLISDDCSSPQRLQAIEEVVAGDPRFVISRSPRRLGFFHNFERALSMVPPNAAFVAMADQDDLWHPDKLETLLGAIGPAQLVYSDARVVDPSGEVLAETYWSLRRNNYRELASLFYANSVTGAASLLRRDLLETALPFPPRHGAPFHDHWVALCALAAGDIAYVDRPLYDYVQHQSATLGHAAANEVAPLRTRLASMRHDPRAFFALWRARYFADNLRLAQLATVLLRRYGRVMTRSKRRALQSYLKADFSSLAMVRLGARAVRELFGPTETLRAEARLACGFLWRRAMSAAAGGATRPRRRLRIDSRPPPIGSGAPIRREPASPETRTLAEKTAPLSLAVRDDAPARINVLIPTIDLHHTFGGYIAKLNLARRLAERGARVRVITVDRTGALKRGWKRTLESYSGLAGLFDRIEVEFGRESQGIEVSRDDRFVASTWWTAHVAHHAVHELGGTSFLYLVQEHEPFTFAMGSLAALAAQSYRLPHTALFSTEMLRDYFRRHALGVYAAGHEEGERDSASFQNAITAVDPPGAGALARRTSRRFLFYARPEPHAARNMYELGILGLARAIQSGAIGREWELHGIGTVESARSVDLGGDRPLELLPRREQDAYGELLVEHDVGLALMYTPHPSLVPIEMASAGMLTVTNSFENKTADALAEISPNLITVEPTVEGVAAGLAAAVAGAGDAEARARGAAVEWSRSWDESFDDALMARVEDLLEPRSA